MVTIGALMAIANGLVNPLMSIVFGAMTDSFILDAKLSHNHNASNPSECSSAEKHQVTHTHMFKKNIKLVFYSRSKQHLRSRYAEVRSRAQKSDY